MYKLTSLLLIAFLFCFTQTYADVKGYRIEVKINNLDQDTCYLGYHFGSKKYIKDTLVANSDGVFVAEGDQSLEGGIYLIIMPPENSYFELFISDENSQHFSIETERSNPIEYMQIKGSSENELFYEYLHYIRDKKEEQDFLIAKEKEETNEKKLLKIQEQIDKIDADIRSYQEEIIVKHKGQLISEVVKLSLPIDVPAPDRPMTEEEESRYRFDYYRTHFFDNVDFSDSRILRTPLFEGKIENFLERLTVKHPDSINIAVDYIMTMAKADDQVFKYTLIHVLNKYARAKIVGMDAVYVYIVDEYYSKGMAPWVPEEELKKIEKRARELRPLLIGKKAPNIQLKKFDGTRVNLYDIESPYILIYFWDPNCGHCNKVAPEIVEFGKNFKDKGLEVYAICTKDKEPEKCAEAVIEKGFQDFINVMALTNQDQYYRLYYAIKSTPVIYILDENKTILSKNIAAAQLGEVMDMLIKRKADLGY